MVGDVKRYRIMIYPHSSVISLVVAPDGLWANWGEASTRLTALEQENKRLREALEPVRKAIHEARWRTVVGTGEEVKRVLFVRSSIDRIEAALTHEDKP